MKPPLELPGQLRSENEFATEVWKQLANRGFYNLNGQVVHIIESANQQTQIIEVTPEYLADYINREFHTFVTEAL